MQFYEQTYYYHYYLLINKNIIKSLLFYIYQNTYNQQPSLSMSNRTIKIAALRHNKPNQPIYFTSQTIYNHSKQFICNSNSSSPPSFLKQSSNTPHLIKQNSYNSSIQNSDTQQTKILEQYQCPVNILQDITTKNLSYLNSTTIESDCINNINQLTRLSESLYKSALKRDRQTKWLLKKLQSKQIKENTEKCNTNLHKIKLKQIVEKNPVFSENQKCELAKNHRTGTLSDEENYCNFQIDENLNFVQIQTQRKLRPIQQQDQEQTQRKINKQIQNNQNTTHRKKQPSQQFSNQLFIEDGHLSTIQIQAKDFWLSSEQFQNNYQAIKTQRLSNNRQPIQKSKISKHLSANSSNLQQTSGIENRIQDISEKKSGIHFLGLNSYETSQISNRNSILTANSRQNTRKHSSCSRATEPRGVYQQILSGYSTAKLLAINRNYKKSNSINKDIKNSELKNSILIKSTKKEGYSQKIYGQGRSQILK